MKENTADPKPRLEYTPPKILYSEKLQARAVACNSGDDSCANNNNGGPIQS